MLNYNAPVDGQKSSIDGTGSDQLVVYKWLRASIIRARDEQFFTPLATTEGVPKHMGKTVKLYEYVPLLDDRNINDQGIDAAGAQTINGNFYGSSRDIGLINDVLPVLSEEGGRVNRVGFTRLQLEGSLHKFGFFTEFTQESLDFDSDEKLMEHLSRELMNGAVKLTEAVLQRDLLAAAGVVMFGGGATDDDEVTGEGATPSVLSFNMLSRLNRILNDNRTPKHTKIVTGSRNIDTKTLNSARIAYIGSDLEDSVKKLTDSFGDKAFIPVNQYADATTLLNGEIGTVDQFRFVVVPEMLKWGGAGATVATDDGGFQTTTVAGAERFDIFPVLVVGTDSFVTLTFQSDGKTFKFNVITKMPGKETASALDPYGETGFSSIKWYYGILVKRPERIAVIKVVAPI